MSAPTSSLALRPGFGRRAAVATLLAMVVAVVLVVATADGPEAVSGGLGGDYASFYAAGDIVLQEPGIEPERFYEPQRQFDAQQPVLPPEEDGHLYFAYPVFFVAPFVALASLEFRLSYLVDVALMVGALVVGLRLLRPCSAVVRERWPETLAVAASFFPMFRGISGGQNTALSLLLFSLLWRSLHDGRQVTAGIAAGLLLFKPPLALPVVGILLLGRHLRAVAAALGAAAALYVLGAALTGPGWPAAWVDAVRYLDEVDTPFNVHNFVSLPGAAEAVFGIDSLAAAVIGFGLAAVVAVVVSWAWMRHAAGPGPLVALGAAGALLISPHALYYDAGLLVLVGIVLLDHHAIGPRTVALLWALGLAHPLLAAPLGVSPVTLLVIAAFGLAARLVVAPSAATGVPTAVTHLGPGWTEPGAPALSVVIPAFEEAGRIEPTLERLGEWLATRSTDAEVIVVDDGSTDDTTDRSLAYAGTVPGLRVLRLAHNRGKGYAVRVGMLAATGRWRAFLDADGSTDPRELDKLFASGATVAIASVAVEGAVLDRPQSGLRSSLGRFGNRVIQGLVLPGIEDSQRGCKLFRGDVAEAVFAECRIDRWGFDVEALALARKLGHEPVEVGVEWEHRPVGHVRPWHYLTTLGDVARVRRAVGLQPPRAVVEHRPGETGVRHGEP